MVTTSPSRNFLTDDAPFEGAASEWVNGYLAGLSAVVESDRARASANAGPDPDAPPLTILYGSQSGTSEALSKQLKKRGVATGYNPAVSTLDGFDFDALPEVKHLLVVCSTFGEGDPPDNAQKFTDWILSDAAPRLEGVSYSVCAMGDRSYTHFCKSGTDLDKRMAELGATRLTDCVTCDVGYEDDFAAWSEAVFTSDSIVEHAGEPPSGLPVEEEVSPTGWDKNNPYFASLLEARNLSGAESAKEVNHIELLLSGSGLEYEVGDALGVWATNDPILVEHLLAHCSVTGTDRVLIKGEYFPIRLALQSKLDVVTLTQATLDDLGMDAEMGDFKGLQLIDAVAKYEPKLSAQGLADALRPLQPRLYSIASSPKAHPGEVHLTVGAVRYELEGSSRKGVASTFLADRCGFGGRVGVYVHKAPHFQLTSDDAAPVIMVGPGTGIAPFRAFLEEREARQATGKSWLFFGDQHEATDFLYREQLEGMQASGVLTKLSLAWSRDGKEKVYVQDLMRAAADELFAWMETGGCFYVCGDAARMAGDVDTALRQIVGGRKGLDEAGVQAYMDALVAAGRYQRDVY